MKINVLGIGVIIFSLSVLTGCATTSDFGGASNRSPQLHQEAQRDLDTAWRQYNKNQFHQTIPNLQHLLSRYPGTRASIESRYLLALCYYEVDGYQDAIESFNEYLRRAPDGKYAEESKRYIQKISIDYEAKFPSDSRLKKQIQEIEHQLATSPESQTLRIRLADRYWMLGSYAQAGDIYMDIRHANPAFSRNQVFNERIDVHDDGSFTLITPDEQTQRAIEKDPVVIINTNSFRSGRELLTRSRMYYIVSGQVVNRSTETMYGVQVYTTIFGFGDVVWDTSTYNVGRMYPGEKRAFSFRFQNFRNIDDINKYECKVTYQR